MAESNQTNSSAGGFFSKIGSRLKGTVGKGFESISPKVSEFAGKVGDKLENAADKITDKIPGGDQLKAATNSAIEKGVGSIGDTAKGMVDQGKEYVNKKVDQGQSAAEGKTTSLLGEISEKIHHTAEAGVSAVTGAASQVGQMAQE